MNHRGIRTLIALSGIVLLTACAATIREVKIPEGLSPESVKQDESILILSTGSPPPQYHEGCTLMLRRLSDGKLVQAVNVTLYGYKSHFEDHHGFLYILRLPPGEYYFFAIVSHSGIEYYYPRLIYRFDVKPNEAVYLGEFYYTFILYSTYERWSHDGRPGYFTLFLNDTFDRDIEIFLRKNPLFRKEDLTKRLAYLVELSLPTTGRLDIYHPGASW